MSDFPGSSHDRPKTSEPSRPFHGDPPPEFHAPRLEGLIDETRSNTLDEVIAFLALEHEHALIRRLRCSFGHPERGHVCAMRDGECPDCGARE
jgi:hypothetical protein